MADRRRRRPGPPPIAAQPDLQRTSSEQEQGAVGAEVWEDALGDLRVRVAALPERQKLVVFLRYFADLSYVEIAEALEIRVGTVSATLNCARRPLRDAMPVAA